MNVKNTFANARRVPRRALSFALADAIAILERTPGTFRALLAGLPDSWTKCDEGPETFSAFENLGHLIHGERADWIARARIILAQGPTPRFERYDRFAQRHESAGKSVDDLLEEFAALRTANLATLRGWNLSDEQLALQGEHPELGRVTLAELLATWAVHDLSHIAQAARVMAKRYGEDVGPWRQYLPILNR